MTNMWFTLMQTIVFITSHYMISSYVNMVRKLVETRLLPVFTTIVLPFLDRRIFEVL